MSFLIGLFGSGAQAARESLPLMQATMRNRANGPVERFAEPDLLIAAGQHDWEDDVPGWNGPSIIVADDWVIAADAAVYYQDDLRRRLGLPLNEKMRTAELLLAAFRRWGERFAEFVEGDFAIVAYDRRRRRVVLARDFGGKRSLMYSITSDGTLVVASSANAVIAGPNVSAEYDLREVAAAAAGLYGVAGTTAFLHVRNVPHGATIVHADGRTSVAHEYELPPFSAGWEDEQSADAAAELRYLIEAASLERLPSSGIATVLMSGGWDSTAVFGAAMSGLEREARDLSLVPVTMRYPADDRGNEDEYVNAVSQHWRTPVRFTEVDNIPLVLDDVRVSMRDDPLPQQFEGMMHHMAGITSELGARIALDGFGGDQLFLVSSGAVLADHFFQARWWRLWQSLRLWGRRAPNAFAEHCLHPYLSREILDLIGLVVGSHVPTSGERHIPPWIVPSNSVRELAQPCFPRLVGESASAWESRLGVMNPLLDRIPSWNHVAAGEAGAQFRSPLFDRRVIEFTARRPLSDRGGGPDSKVLLRRAMRGLLPDSVLAARSTKTGTTIDYFRRSFQTAGPARLRSMFAAGQSRLERLGILDQSSIQRAISRYETTGSHAAGVALHITSEVERWLALRESLR